MSAPGYRDQLTRAVERLESVIRRENETLGGSLRDIDFVELNRLKCLGLLQLASLGRDIERTGLDETARAALSRLRGLLEENADALQLRVRAMTEISELLTGALREAESDGTYGNPCSS